VAVLVAVVRCGGHHHPVPSVRAGEPAAGAPAAPGPAVADERPGTAGPSPSAKPAPPPDPLPRSPATRLRVPSLGIDAPIVAVKVGAGQQLETPPLDKPKLVGWYQDGASPGEAGTAIAVGHRDTRTGAAVFAALAQVRPGRTIEARRLDGRTAVYTVDRVRVFDKARFPDKEVYGPSKRPELRVLTCGGLFSRRTGYTSNVVVFAHLSATR
jgi:sortase (surface protein transpeptidase)